MHSWLVSICQFFTEFRVLKHERNFQICKNREENSRGKRSLFSNLGRIPPFLLCCHLMNNWWDLFPESQLWVFWLFWHLEGKKILGFFWSWFDLNASRERRKYKSDIVFPFRKFIRGLWNVEHLEMRRWEKRESIRESYEISLKMWQEDVAGFSTQ